MIIKRKNSGFTIVELLIVVVIIAILAAIISVAYSGIQQRAKAAVLQTNLSNATKYLKTQQITSGNYPTNKDVLPGSDGVTYELSANNSSSPKTFCLTGTKDGLSFKANNLETPSEGICSGHVGNGSTIITNLVLNPSFEINNNGWHGTRADSLVVDGAGQFGGKVLRVTVNAVGYVPRVYISNGLASPVTPGSSYRVSAWVKSSSPVVLLAQPLNTSYTNAGASVTQTFTSEDSWTYITMTIGVPDPSAVYMTVWIGFTSNTAIGTSVDIDSVMLTQGTNLYQYTDGSSAGWTWSGAPHASTSTGPAAQD